MATQTDSQGRVIVDVQDQNAPPQYTPDGQQLPGPMSKMNAGIPETTPSTVSQNSIDQTHAAANQTPGSPSATPAGASQATADKASADNADQIKNASASKDNQPHPMSKIFDSMLKMASGGPIFVNDPVTGQRREVPQSRGSMARAITAAALSGLFTPNQYRPGPFGGSVLDRSGTMAAAGRAGMQESEERRKQIQDTVNDANARHMLTLQNNVKLATQMAALTHQRHQYLDDIVNKNTELYSKPIQELNGRRQGNEPSYFVGNGLTVDELQSKGFKTTDHNVYVDGTVDKPNENGEMEPHPTYAVVRTTGADGKPLMLNLPQEVTNELGKFSVAYEKAFDLTKGNVNIPINNYMDAVHTANTLGYMEQFLNRLNTQVNGDKAPAIDFAAKYKANPNAYAPAIKTLESAMASGVGRDIGTDDQLVRGLRTTPYGSNLLGLLGKTEDVDKWAQEKQDQREEAYRESVSTGQQKGKSLWEPISSASKAEGVLADVNQPPVRRVQAQKFLDIKSVFDAREARAKEAVRAGDPEAAGQLLANGQLSLQELKSRGSSPDFITRAVNAATRLQPGYNAQQADAEYAVARNQANQVFFGSAKSLTDPGGTLEMLIQAHAALGNTRIPVFNSIKDALEFQAGNPELGNYMQVALGVADDYAKVIGGGNPTEGMQLMQFNSMANKFNDGQIEAIVRGMRGTVNSQVKSRIGNSRILQQMYGTGMQGINNQPRTTAAPPMSAFIDPSTQKPIPDGIPVTFGNGQVWQLNKGVPTQVKQQGQPQPQQ